jgi:uncharacterized protein GlcG (DUF336 family)
MHRKWCLTLDDARTMAAACRTEAAKHRKAPTIAVVDSGGQLVYFERADSDSPLGIDMSLGKARTSALRARSSHALEERVKERPGFLMMPNCLPVRGGVPLFFEGECVGGIAVSGIGELDEPVAEAGANALLLQDHKK